jgi:hypothetical protein
MLNPFLPALYHARFRACRQAGTPPYREGIAGKSPFKNKSHFSLPEHESAMKYSVLEHIILSSWYFVRKKSKLY